jgi:hypothetical protein
LIGGTKETVSIAKAIATTRLPLAIATATAIGIPYFRCNYRTKSCLSATNFMYKRNCGFLSRALL